MTTRRRVVVGGVAAAIVVALSANAVLAQEDVPAGFEDWDTDGGGMLQGDEWDAMTSEQRDDLRAWLDSLGDDEARDWVDSQVSVSVKRELDLPEDSVADQIIEGGGARVEDQIDQANRAVDEVAEVPGEVASGVADSAFASMANAVGEAAGDLVGRVGEALSGVGTPTFLEEPEYQRHYERMLGWAGLLMLPLAMVAIGGAVVRGETAKVGETVLQVPIAYMLGVLAISLVAAAGGLAQAMTTTLAGDIRESSAEVGSNVGTLLAVEAGVMGPGLILLLGLVIGLAALTTLIWLVLTEAAVYGVVLFAPVAFAGRVWPQTSGWGRKLLTLAFALVAAKVVIFALWALAVDGLAAASDDVLFAPGGEESGADVSVWNGFAIAALLVLTAFSPVAVLRMVPMVEGASAAGDPGQVMAKGRALAPQAGQVLGMGSGISAVGAGRAAAGRLPIAAGSGGGGSSRQGASGGGGRGGGGSKPPVDTSGQGAGAGSSGPGGQGTATSAVGSQAQRSGGRGPSGAAPPSGEGGGGGPSSGEQGGQGARRGAASGRGQWAGPPRSSRAPGPRGGRPQ